MFIKKNYSSKEHCAARVEENLEKNQHPWITMIIIALKVPYRGRDFSSDEQRPSIHRGFFYKEAGASTCENKSNALEQH